MPSFVKLIALGALIQFIEASNLQFEEAYKCRNGQGGKFLNSSMRILILSLENQYFAQIAFEEGSTFQEIPRRKFPEQILTSSGILLHKKRTIETCSSLIELPLMHSNEDALNTAMKLAKVPYDNTIFVIDWQNWSALIASEGLEVTQAFIRLLVTLHDEKGRSFLDSFKILVLKPEDNMLTPNEMEFQLNNHILGDIKPGLAKYGSNVS